MDANLGKKKFSKEEIADMLIKKNPYKTKSFYMRQTKADLIKMLFRE